MTSGASLAALLLDFDGPLTDLMPYPVNLKAANAARAGLDGVVLPDVLRDTSDHLEVLRYVNETEPSWVPRVIAACVDAEVDAAQHSTPSPHAEDLFAIAEARNLSVAVVSNNDAAAVRAFLERFGWTRHISYYACRTPERISTMKPAPDLLGEALAALDTPPSRCLFVGDSVTDVQAGRTVGIPVLALAKTRGRYVELLTAGADAVINLGDRAHLIAELTSQ